MKNDRKTKNELIAKLESVHRKIKRLESQLKKHKHTKQDITERKRAEEKLRESEARYRSLFENSIIGISQALPDGRLLCANSAYAQMYGYKNPEEMMTHVSDVGQLYANPEDREEVLSILKEKGSMAPREMTVKRRDGTRFFVLVGAREIKDSKGNLLYYQAEHVDITERKRVEKQVFLLAHTLKSVAECVSITDLNDTILFVNNAFLKTYGYSEHEILGKNISVVRSPNNPPEATGNILAATLAGGWSGELMNRTKDGRDFPVSLSTSFVRDEQGQDIALVGIATNITERKRIEATLRESELHYRALFNHMSSGVVVYEAIDNGGDFIFRDLNPAAERIEKVSRKDILGKRVSEVFQGIKAFGIFEVFQRVWQTGKPEYFPQNIYKDDKNPGSWRENWIFKLPTGEIIAIYNDISERKQVEEALQESELKYRTLFKSMSQGFYVSQVLCDEKGIPCDYMYLDVNPAFEQIVGLKREQIIGKTYNELVSPDPESGWPECFKRVAMTGIPENYIFSSKIYNCYFEAYAFKPEEGKFCALVKDITESIRAKEVLRQSEERYRNLFDASPDGIVVIGSDGRITSANIAQGRMYRYDSPNDLIGVNATELVAISSRDFSAQILQRRLNGEDIPPVEYELVRKDGTTFFGETSATILRGADGTVSGYICVTRGTTERKQTEEELSKSHEELSKSHEELRMLANHLQNIREEERNRLAREFHDQIGQSMTALKMDLSLLLRMISDEKQDVPRKLVAEELQSMQKLVDETSQLLWAIITELQPQMLDDLGLVATLEWESQRFESRTGISCEFKSTAGDIQMDFKKSIALFRIYQEALTNIIRHANATIVKSGLQRDGEMLVLSIKDNGCGISIDEQFKQKPFGLIGMRERALAIGGMLEISGIIGEGTTIIVRLPIGQVAVEESTRQ